MNLRALCIYVQACHVLIRDLIRQSNTVADMEANVGRIVHQLVQWGEIPKQ